MNIPGYDQNPSMAAMQGGGDDQGDQDQNAQPQGDGLHHLEIHEMPDLSAHSTATKPDGSVEEMDHDSYEEACAACGGDADNANGEDDGEDAPADFADDGEDSGMDNIAASYGSKAKH